MAVKLTRSLGMTLLGFWLILNALNWLGPFQVPHVLMAAFALLAGVLILLGR